MLPANPWKSYRQVAAQTATPGQLILMLYDAALRDLGRALLGFDMQDPAERNQTINNNINRAQQILHGLIASLDMKKGGELAMHLQRLYDYMNRRLFESNVKKRPDGIHEVIRHLTEIRNSWAKMLQGETSDIGQAETVAPLQAA